MFLLNGNQINIYAPYTTEDGVTYPHLRDADIREALGITEEADPVLADERFYWGGDVNNPRMLEDREEVDVNGDPMWVQVLDKSDPDPENWSMVDSEERLVTKGLKSDWKTQIKNKTNTLLAPTDWMVIRKYERDVAIPADVITYRAAVLTECGRLETAIDSAADIDAFIAVVNSQDWPTL